MVVVSCLIICLLRRLKEKDCYVGFECKQAVSGKNIHSL